MLVTYSETAPNPVRYCCSWGKLVPPQTGSTPFNHWLEVNLRNKKATHPNGIPWQTIFASALWQIWKARNSLQFDNLDFDANQVAFKSIELATETFNAFKSNSLNNLKITNYNLIKWTPPPNRSHQD